jgi:ABC-2 type transport system permease protein
VVLFVSSAFFPANLMLEPAASVAEYNPLSFIVEGLREPIIAEFDGGDELLAVVSVVALGAFGLWMCALALRGRARRGV